MTLAKIQTPPSPTLPDILPTLSAEELRQLCLDCGADDAGFISIDRS